MLVAIVVAAAPSVADAGNVVAKLSGGKLTLTGDDAPNELTIDQVGVPADSLRVIPGVGTTIDGSATPQVFASSTAGLKILLGDQDDKLLVRDTVLAGKLEIRAGGGRDDLAIDTTTTGSGVKVDLGEGPNALAICFASLGGKLAVEGGAALPIAAVPPSCPSSTDEALDVPGTAVLVRESVVAGDLTFAGDEGFDGLSLIGVAVAGKLKMRGGADGAVLLICNATIGKDVAVDFDEATAGVGTFECPGFSESGAFAYVEGKGSLVAMRDVQVGGNTTIDAASAAVALTQLTVSRSLALKLGKLGTPNAAICQLPGRATILEQTPLGSAVALCGLDVGGKLDARFGATPASINGIAVFVAAVAKAWNVAFAAGSGALYGADVVAESVGLASGDGRDEVTIVDATIAKKGAVDLAGGPNTVGIYTTTFGGNLVVKTGDGDDFIDVASAWVGGKKTVKNGNGTDTVVLQ